MLIIACISLLALMFLGVPITFSLLGAGFLAVLLGNGSLPMYMNCRGFISGVNSYWVEKGNRNMTINERKAKVNPFSYGIVATASYGAFGLYFKFYPKSSRLLPDGSVDLSYTTVGIVLGL